MSIKLRFEHPSMQMQAVLKDDALMELLKFITTHKSDEFVSPMLVSPMPSAFEDSLPASLQGTNLKGDRSAAIKAWLAKHSAAEILNKIKWDTNPEKILLMGAFHESKVETDSWRSADMETRFSEAKETQPANFPRDIAASIKSGFVTTVTPRTYIVSRTGWNKIADAIAKLPAE
jgi:hypothetical protein